MKYLEAVPWDGEESAFLQKTCQEVGFGVDSLLRELEQQGKPLSQSARAKVLKGVLDIKDQSKQAHELKIELLEKGKLSTELLESRLRGRITDLEAKVTSFCWTYRTGSGTSTFRWSDEPTLQALWYYAELKMKVGLDLKDLINVLSSASKGKHANDACIFHDNGCRPQVRNAFHRVLYQHLLAAVRKGEAVLDPGCRVKLLSLWSPSTATDDSLREVTVTADVRALLSKVEHAERENLITEVWLPSILAAVEKRLDPSVKEWLLDMLQDGAEVRAELFLGELLTRHCL